MEQEYYIFYRIIPCFSETFKFAYCEKCGFAAIEKDNGFICESCGDLKRSSNKLREV